MAETAPVSQSVVALPEGQLKSQRTMREVRAHAAVVAEGGDSAEMRGARARLSLLLASDQPLRTNVPRGYYLNFTV